MFFSLSLEAFSVLVHKLCSLLEEQENRKGLCKENQVSIERLKKSLLAFTYNIFDIGDNIFTLILKS